MVSSVVRSLWTSVRPVATAAAEKMSQATSSVGAFVPGNLGVKDTLKACYTHFKSGAKSLFSGLKNLIFHPIKTLQGAFSAISAQFGKIVNKIKSFFKPGTAQSAAHAESAAASQTATAGSKAAAAKAASPTAASAAAKNTANAAEDAGQRIGVPPSAKPTPLNAAEKAALAKETGAQSTALVPTSSPPSVPVTDRLGIPPTAKAIPLPGPTATPPAAGSANVATTAATASSSPPVKSNIVSTGSAAARRKSVMTAGIKPGPSAGAPSKAYPTGKPNGKKVRQRQGHQVNQQLAQWNGRQGGLNPRG